MNTLTINGKLIGECSRPRERGYGNPAYVFLMKQNYYITIENSDILNLDVVEENEKSNNYNYMFELREI